MKNLFVTAAVAAALTGSAMADIEASSGWEDTSSPAILGSFGNLFDWGYESGDVYSGSHSLYMIEDPVSGTPQGYVAWVTGLSAGDTVTATMWMKGASNGVDNDGKGRLWGHYSSDDDITTYFGSASGSGDYAGEGGIWTQASHTWTIADGQTALVIEARMYSYGENNFLLGDDLVVSTNNDGAMITVAGVIPAPGAIALLGVAGLASRRRRG
jgi:MYXO-CTERM domain-containing protein